MHNPKTLKSPYSFLEINHISLCTTLKRSNLPMHNPKTLKSPYARPQNAQISQYTTPKRSNLQIHDPKTLKSPNALIFSSLKDKILGFRAPIVKIFKNFLAVHKSLIYKKFAGVHQRFKQ
jgi:hypothetical protein